MTAAPDGPSLGELGRGLDQFRKDFKEEVGRLNQRLDNLVTREVMERVEAALVQRIEEVRRAADDLEKQQAKFEEARAQDRRILVTAFIAPFLMLIFTLYLTAQIGAK